ncbi:MAG: D-cysteine desulfhydrase family protein [Thermomicrobiales bacterium]
MSIGSQPRISLAVLPTPLQEAKNLRAALGGAERCPRILIKRDDLTGLAFGGNKARKLEFLVADALAHDTTVLVTSGAVQSNHARMTAAAARIAGVKVFLVLIAKGPDPALQGNLLLDRLLDAEVRFVMPGEDADERIAATMVDLRDRGERPYLIPVGGSNAIGSFGYVTATLELVTQLFQMGEAPSRLYYASGSRGTQAGLALGAKMYSAPYRLHGIATSSGDPEKTERAVAIANEAAAMLRVPTRLTADELLTDGGYIGEGYGIPTAAGLEAIRLLAHNEGIFLDPVYSGKVMAGMIDHIRRGDIAPRETIVFLHTGGSPALFAQVDQLGFSH